MSQFFEEARVHHPRPQWTQSPNLTSQQLPWFIPCLWFHWIQTELQNSVFEYSLLRHVSLKVHPH
ncbi:hypothetical protein QTP88_018038 [Uroleucon formosanum]